MDHILYVDCTKTNQNETLSVLRQHLQNENIESVLGIPQALTKLKNGFTPMVILDCNEFMVNELKFITTLESLRYGAPILILSYESEFVKLLADRRKIKSHLTVKPVEPMQVVGLMHKLMLEREPPQQRVNKRYLTNEFARLESMEGESIGMKVFNLSMGGAYCELEMSGQLAVGDFVRLSVNLMESQNHHTLYARVVWVAQANSLGKQGVGLQFIRRQNEARLAECG